MPSLYLSFQFYVFKDTVDSPLKVNTVLLILTVLIHIPDVTKEWWKNMFCTSTVLATSFSEHTFFINTTWVLSL